MTGLVVALAAVAAATVVLCPPPPPRPGLHGERRRPQRVVGGLGGGPAAGRAAVGPVRRGVRAWRRPAARSAAAANLPAPLLLDLLAALLESGAAPTGALRTVGRALSAEGDCRAAQILELAVRLEQGILHPEAKPPPGAGPGAGPMADPALAGLADALRMAVAAGLPPATLVRRAATQERRRLDAAGRRAVRRLEVLLVLPMGLCLLPAFVLLGIAPVVIDLLAGG